MRRSNQKPAPPSYKINCTTSAPMAYIAGYAQASENYNPVLLNDGSVGISPYGASQIDGRFLPVYGGQPVDQSTSANLYDATRTGIINSCGPTPGYYSGLSTAGSVLASSGAYGAILSVPYGFPRYIPYQNISYATAQDTYGQSAGIPLQPIPSDSPIPGLIQISTPGAPIQTTKDLQGPEGCNLFVFHIPNDMTNNDLYSLFSEYGEVISARIMVDKASGRSRGFGFVSFNERKSADDAIKGMNGCHIGHKRLKVQHKKEKDRMDHTTPTHLIRQAPSPNSSNIPLYMHAFVGTDQHLHQKMSESNSMMRSSVGHLNPSNNVEESEQDALVKGIQNKLKLDDDSPVEEESARKELYLEEKSSESEGNNDRDSSLRAPVASINDNMCGEQTSPHNSTKSSNLSSSLWKDDNTSSSNEEISQNQGQPEKLVSGM